MTRISSRFTTFHKRIFPALPLVGAAALFLGDIFKNGAMAGADLIGPFLMGIISLGIGFRVWNLVDEVYACDDYLLVKNRGLEEAIPLSKVMNVSATVMTNHPRVTLRLVEPSSFGKEIAFCPAALFSVNPFSRSSIVDDLIIRVDRARSTRAVSQGGAK